MDETDETNRLLRDKTDADRRSFQANNKAGS